MHHRPGGQQKVKWRTVPSSALSASKSRISAAWSKAIALSSAKACLAPKKRVANEHEHMCCGLSFLLIILQNPGTISWSSWIPISSYDKQAEQQACMTSCACQPIAHKTARRRLASNFFDNHYAALQQILDAVVRLPCSLQAFWQRTGCHKPHKEMLWWCFLEPAIFFL